MSAAAAIKPRPIKPRTRPVRAEPELLQAPVELPVTAPLLSVPVETRRESR